MTRARPRDHHAPGGGSKPNRRPSGRYTPPSRTQEVVRPRWHRIVGWFVVTLGLVIAALNGLMYMSDDLTLLPGGFSLLYVLGGLPVAAAGTWFLGIFDEGSTEYR